MVGSTQGRAAGRAGRAATGRGESGQGGMSGRTTEDKALQLKWCVTKCAHPFVPACDPRADDWWGVHVLPQLRHCL